MSVCEAEALLGLFTHYLFQLHIFFFNHVYIGHIDTLGTIYLRIKKYVSMFKRQVTI